MKLGALATNVGTMVVKPKARDGLADRILTEDEAAALLAACEGRDLALVAVLYRAALPVPEACALRWSDVTAAKDGGAIVTVYGKGGKMRAVRIEANTVGVLAELRGAAPADAPVFAGRAGAAIHPVTA